MLATRRGSLTLLLLCAVQFIDIADSSIMNVAPPSIQRDLGFRYRAGLAIFSAIATSRTSALLAARASRAEALTAGFHQALLACAIFLLAAAGIALRANNIRGESAAQPDHLPASHAPMPAPERADQTRPAPAPAPHPHPRRHRHDDRGHPTAARADPALTKGVT